MNDSKERIEKQRCPYELFVEEYWALPTDYPSEKIVSGADYGQLVNMLAMFDYRRNQWHKDNLANVMHERDLEIAALKTCIEKLLPLAQNHASELRWDEEHSGDEVGGKEAQAIIDEAKKLIEK